MAHAKYNILVTPLDRAFGRGSKKVNAHIMRVAVLYEDMRLENIAASQDSIPSIDTVGRQFRLFYFIRRSIGTLHEFAEAIPLLDREPEFADIRARFTVDQRTAWDKSVRAFGRHRDYIEKIRDDFGGHFGVAPAWHAVNDLPATAVALEFQHNREKRTTNTRHKYASEIVAIGMGRHKRGDTSHDHFRLMARLALVGFSHAARCVHFLSDHYILPQFRG